MNIIISILLFSLASNIDNLIIFTSINVNNNKLKFYHFVIISLVSSIITGLTMKYAHYITLLISIQITNLIGASLLIILGLILISSYLIKRPLQKFLANTITPKFIFALSFGLSINNIPTAISASLTGLPILTSSITIFINSMLFLYLGIYLKTKAFQNILSKYANLITGIMLIILGIFQIVF